MQATPRHPADPMTQSNHPAAKHWLHSKTILFNLAVAVLTVLAGQMDTLHALLSERGYLAAMLLVAVGNALLRTVTTTAITRR